MSSSASREVQLRELLIYQRDSTMERIHTLRDEEQAQALNDPGDVEDHAKSLADVETYAGLIDRDELKLRDINDALDRLSSGEFGKCANCGNDIPVERLRAIPFATTCVDCQAEDEHVAPSVSDEERREFKRWNPPHEIGHAQDDEPGRGRLDEPEVTAIAMEKQRRNK